MKTSFNPPEPSPFKPPRREQVLSHPPAPSAPSTLRTIWGAIDRFFFAPSTATTLGLMRIFGGAVALYVLFGYAIDLAAYVGPDAWVRMDTMDWVRKEMVYGVPSSGWDNQEVVLGKGQPMWSIYFHVQSMGWIWSIHLGLMLATLAFTVGFATRITSVLTWMAYIMYIHRSPSTLFGMDTMMNLVLLYLMIAPCGAALSVDRWLKVRKLRKEHGPAYNPPPEKLVSATFATRLVQINFCVIYMMAGMSKLLGASWWNFTAPNLFMLNYSFAPFDVGLYSGMVHFLAKHRWLWEAQATFGVVFTLFTELSLPYLIWLPRWRWFMMCCSAILHTMIGLLMGLVTFSLAMLVMLLAFMPPEVTEQVLARIRQRLRKLRGSPAARAIAKQEAPLVMAR